MDWKLTVGVLGQTSWPRCLVSSLVRFKMASAMADLVTIAHPSDSLPCNMVTFTIKVLTYISILIIKTAHTGTKRNSYKTDIVRHFFNSRNGTYWRAEQRRTVTTQLVVLFAKPETSRHKLHRDSQQSCPAAVWWYCWPGRWECDHAATTVRHPPWKSQSQSQRLSFVKT